MQRAATDVMQSILFSAVLEAIAALKSASRGLPNNLLRDVQAIHPNVTFVDLPKELQDSITASVRAAFTQLLKDGYSVASRDAPPPVRRPPPRHDAGPRRGPGNDRRPPRGGGGGAAPDNKGPRGPRGPGGGPSRPRKPTKGKPRLS